MAHTLGQRYTLTTSFSKMEADLELDSEDNTGLTAQPVRKNISLKLKTKSKSTSALGKTKKKETKSSDRKVAAIEGEKEVRKKQRSPAASGPKPQVKELEWNHKIMIIGQKVQDPLLHLCEKCSLPILVYGRLSPCKHSFCLSCAEKGAGKCPRCGDGVQRIERAPLGSVFVCSFGGSRYGISGCRRSYFSQRDLQSHIKRRHQRQQAGGDSDGNEDAETEVNRVVFPPAGGGVPFFLHPPRETAPTAVMPHQIAAGERPFSSVPLPGAVSMETRHFVQTIPRDAFFMEAPRPQPQHPPVSGFPAQAPPQVAPAHITHVQPGVFPHPEPAPPPRFEEMRAEPRVSRPIPVQSNMDDGFGRRGSGGPVPGAPGFRFPGPDPEARPGNWQPRAEGEWLQQDRPPVRSEREWIPPPGRTERDWVPPRSEGNWTPRGRVPQGDPHYRPMF